MTFTRGDAFQVTGTIRKAEIHGATKAKVLDVK